MTTSIRLWKILAVLLGICSLTWTARLASGTQNSASFFPIGLYCVEDPQDFREIAHAGFNLVQAYRFEGRDTATDEEAKAYLDAARRAGLRVLMGIQQEAVQNLDLAMIGQRVRALQSHPALFGWQLYDEPENPAYGRGQPLPPGHLLRAYQTIKRLDAIHPVTIAPNAAIDDQYDYLEGADLFLLQYSALPPGLYPYPWDSLAHLRDAHRSSFSTLAGKDKPFIFVLQAYNLANDPNMWPSVPNHPPKSRGRYPTRDEMRFMAYSGIIHGATGVIFNCYRFKNEDGTTADDISRRANPTQWAAVSSVSTELRSMLPVLVAPSQERQRAGVALKGEAQLEMLIKQRPWMTYLLTANPSARPARLQLHLAQDRFPNPQITLLPQKQRILAQGGSFDGHWNPYEVRVYEIRAGR
jgi:hypothetical protein